MDFTHPSAAERTTMLDLYGLPSAAGVAIGRQEKSPPSAAGRTTPLMVEGPPSAAERTTLLIIDGPPSAAATSVRRRATLIGRPGGYSKTSKSRTSRLYVRKSDARASLKRTSLMPSVSHFAKTFP